MNDNCCAKALDRMLGHLEHQLQSDDVLVIRCKELIEEYKSEPQEVVKDE